MVANRCRDKCIHRSNLRLRCERLLSGRPRLTVRPNSPQTSIRIDRRKNCGRWSSTKLRHDQFRSFPCGRLSFLAVRRELCRSIRHLGSGIISRSGNQKRFWRTIWRSGAGRARALDYRVSANICSYEHYPTADRRTRDDGQRFIVRLDANTRNAIALYLSVTFSPVAPMNRPSSWLISHRSFPF